MVRELLTTVPSESLHFHLRKVSSTNKYKVRFVAGGAPGQLDGERDEFRADAGRRRQAHHLPRREPQRHLAVPRDLVDHQRRV